MAENPFEPRGASEEAEAPAQKPPPPRQPAGGPPAPSTESGKLMDLYLEESGQVQQDLIEIAGMDVERDHHQEALLAQGKASKPETFYSDLIYTLTHLRYEEQEARVLWVNLLTHKYDMSYRLGRNVGVRVAALDYFKNVIGVLDDVKIIDASAYIETAQLALTDGLTGVFNHRYFQDRLLRDVNRIKEEGGTLSLLMLDMDHFKTYNDVNGHIAGDVALKEVASLLRRHLKKEDLVARYGGEEFAVILWGLDRYPAHTVAERIRSVVEETRFPNEKVLPGGRLTVSIGLAECPADAEDRGDLISAADRGLYIAKRTGRNRVEMAPPDQRRERRGRFARHIAYGVGGAAGTAPPQEALTLNLSTGGVCLLAASGALAVGQLVEVQLAAPAEDKALLGHVVWQVPRPHEQCQVGVKFVNLSAEDARWIETLMGH